MDDIGLEPTTSTMSTCDLRVLTENLSELTSTASDACTNACTSETKNAQGSGSNAASIIAPVDVPEAPARDFAAALLMIATLPLSDVEKAEAVRRLLNKAN